MNGGRRPTRDKGRQLCMYTVGPYTDLFKCIEKTSVKLIFVAEETGWGVVPAYPLGRLFRDRLGYIVFKLGNIVDPTYLVIGG